MKRVSRKEPSPAPVASAPVTQATEADQAVDLPMPPVPEAPAVPYGPEVPRAIRFEVQQAKFAERARRIRASADPSACVLLNFDRRDNTWVDVAVRTVQGLAPTAVRQGFTARGGWLTTLSTRDAVLVLLGDSDARKHVEAALQAMPPSETHVPVLVFASQGVDVFPYELPPPPAPKGAAGPVESVPGDEPVETNDASVAEPSDAGSDTPEAPEVELSPPTET